LPIIGPKVRKALLSDFAIEIGGGLGQFAGKVWRGGLMGRSCRRKNVFLFPSAFEAVLKAEGSKARPGATEAATAVRLRNKLFEMKGSTSL
jgi:alanine-glyoxylate transaminase / serine-glyoxylate transaminase / serine-pyruvate transaminase